jgi:hypothetical protein
MFSLTPRRSSRKWICSVAATMAAAAIAVTALAGSAFAVTDTFQTLTPSSDPAVQLGGQGSCQPGLPPGADAVLDWRDNSDGTIQPKLTASLCLQNTTATYRVALQLYYLDSTPGPGGTHIMISESKSLPATGNGAAVNDFSVNLQGPKVLGATVKHAHVQLQKQVGGVWQDVTGADSFATADF